MGELRSIRLLRGVLAVLLLSAVGGCKRENRNEAASLTASLMFDNASPDAREALASRVDFRITDASFAQWEKAQRNLEKLPRSAIPSAPGIGSTAVDRAVSRLESSPYARTAIERTGLSVREFVLQTIALAQVAEAAQTGKSLSGATIPPENFLFVQRYTTRVLYSRSRARTESRTYDWDADAADINSMQNEGDAQMQLDESEHPPSEPTSDSSRNPARDSSRNPAQDSVQDSVPTQPR